MQQNLGPTGLRRNGILFSSYLLGFMALEGHMLSFNVFKLNTGMSAMTTLSLPCLCSGIAATVLWYFFLLLFISALGEKTRVGDLDARSPFLLLI